MSLEALTQLTATGLAGLFTGAAAFISVAQHPALLETRDEEFQGPYFRRMYFYAARMQGPLAIGSGLSALAVYFLQRSRSCCCACALAPASAPAAMPRMWLASGLIMVAMVPYTITRMLALNLRLTDPRTCRRHRGGGWLQTMLRQWGRLHDIRTGASLVAFTGMLVALTCAPVVEHEGRLDPHPHHHSNDYVPRIRH